MCEISLVHGLPFVQAELVYRDRRITVDNVLVDTGSGGTVFSADRLLDLDLRFERGDAVHRIRGVGGAEFVFAKHVDALALGSFQIRNFQIEVGAMDYGFQIDGILGMNFLLEARAVLDLGAKRLTCPA